MVAVETCWDGVRKEDDNKDNIAMLINLLQIRSIYLNKEKSRSDAIWNSDIQCNNFSKIEDTWWWPYTAEACNVEEGWLYNKLYLRLKTRGLIPQTNYTDRATTACRRSFADRECRVVSATDPHGRILGFLDRSRYYFFQVAPQLYSRGWLDPVPDPQKMW
jgi:hypothetical protein